MSGIITPNAKFDNLIQIPSRDVDNLLTIHTLNPNDISSITLEYDTHGKPTEFPIKIRMRFSDSEWELNPDMDSFPECDTVEDVHKFLIDEWNRIYKG